MLNKIQLLVAGADRKILTLRRLVGPFCAERRVGQNAVKPLSVKWLIDRVPDFDLSGHAMQEQVHHGKPCGTRYQILSVISFGLDPIYSIAIQTAFGFL